MKLSNQSIAGQTSMPSHGSTLRLERHEAVARKAVEPLHEQQHRLLRLRVGVVAARDKLEEEEGNWIDINNYSINGDYLPNEKDQTCGIFTKTGYIVGGEDAKIGEFPFLAALGKQVLSP